MNSLLRFFLLMLFPLTVLAVPNTINYQGRLLDSAGIPVGYPTSTSLPFVISIWDHPSSSLAINKKYEESQTVTVDDGVYVFQIGAGTPSSGFTWNPTTLFNVSSPRYVQLTISGNTLTPRHQLLSTPFTLQSGNSDNLGGQPISYFGTSSQISSLQGQIDSLSTQLIDICNASATAKWSYNNGFCFGGTPAKCKGSNFDKENFPGVTLNNADCTGAKFTNVNFIGASFGGTTLMNGADFSGADMTGVAFQNATDLSNAISTGNKGALTIIWNNGVKCPDKYVLTKVPTESCLQHGWSGGG